MEVQVNLTARDPIDVKTRVHIAIIERTVIATDLSTDDQGLITNGETEFRNVLRRMLPDAAGTEVQSLLKGDTFTYSESWVIDNALDPDQLSVVVFVQSDEEGSTIAEREILQARSKNVSGAQMVTGLEDEILAIILKDMVLYPNPAQKEVNVLLNYELQNEITWQVINQIGVRLAEGVVGRGSKAFTIDVSAHPSGMYLLYVGNKNEFSYRKFLIARE